MYRIIVSIALILLVSASPAFAKSYLLFLEAQGVGGYSEENDEAIYYSMNPVDVERNRGLGVLCPSDAACLQRSLQSDR